MQTVEITNDMRFDGVKLGDIVDGAIVIGRGYREIPGLPDYVVNKSGNIRNIHNWSYAKKVRQTKSGATMVEVFVNGHRLVRSNINLRDLAFS